MKQKPDPRYPSACLICHRKVKLVGRHMRRMHKAFLCWDDDYGWTYIYD